MMLHPLRLFVYCPSCGSNAFEVRNEKAKRCADCGFIYYFNPSAAVACFLRNQKGELLIVRRANDPAIGMLDLPGGFSDSHESAEEAVYREVREETGLVIDSCRYLFSLPNIYPYMGFDVHTLDLFFECTVDGFEGMKANDDASEIIVLAPGRIRPEEFGLESVRKAASLYINSYLYAY